MNILIYVKKSKLRPIGGPVGYCYNILQEKILSKDGEVTFLDRALYRKTAFPFLAINRMRAAIYTNLLHKSKEFSNVKNCKYDSMHANKVDLSNYDIVHFHSTYDLYGAKKELKSYKGTVLLTSHSPKVLYKEIIEDVITYDEYIGNKIVFDSAEEFDDYAFKRADYIIFPCPGAEEPYYHSWPKYAELRDEKKIRYIPTGILPVECKKTREDIRNELNIPQDATVLSFVGRHNEVKGYDILQSIFSKLENVYVVCCGKIGSIQPPKSDRWIEVGWTTDPYSYVGASDIYMLPNRETYFDIAMLQTLSIGKCSVISNTGGNKEFTNTPGVKLYDTVEEAVECIKEYMAKSVEERSSMENQQRKEFEEKYTIEVFYKNYKKTLRELMKEKNNNG